MIAKLIRSMRAGAPLLALLVMRSWAAMKVRESDGQNRGPVVDAIHELSEAAGGNGDKEDAAPWCARAVNVAWYLAGLCTFQRVDPVVSRSGSVFYLLHSTFRRAPELVIFVNTKEAIEGLGDLTKVIKPGDAMIRYTVKDRYRDVPFDELERKMTESGHVEIVQKVHKDGTLDTVGGNTDHDTAREGNGVFVHRGRYSVHEDRVVAFVRPRYLPLSFDD